MSALNFEYRVSPRGPERGSRFVTKADGGALTKGVPVLVTGANDGLGRAVVELATGDSAKPKAGNGGVLDFEVFRMDGYDPVATPFSDVDTVDQGRPAQVVTGENRVKFVLRNTDRRTMVDGLGPSGTLAVGDYLTPGTGNDIAGYWTETATADNAWLVVTDVDPDGDWVEVVVNY